MNYELQGYLDRFNHIRELFDKPPLMLENDYDEILAMMEAEGSPENLSMDGKISVNSYEKRARIWKNAMIQLNAFKEERL